MLVLPVRPDTEQGEVELKKWQARVHDTYLLYLQARVDTEGATAGLQQIATEAKKTGGAVEGIFANLKTERAVSSLSAASHIVDGLATSFLGLDGAASKALTTTTSWATQGATALSFLGPEGALVGGLGGAIAGAAASLVGYNREEQKRQEAARQARLDEEAAQIQALADGWRDAIVVIEKLQGLSVTASQGFFALADSIDATLNPEKLPKGAKALNAALTDSATLLQTAQGQAKDYGQAVESLESKLEQLKLTGELSQKSQIEMNDLESQLADKRELLQKATVGVATETAHYTRIEDALTDAHQKNAAAVKASTTETERAAKAAAEAATKAQKELDDQAKKLQGEAEASYKAYLAQRQRDWELHLKSQADASALAFTLEQAQRAEAQKADDEATKQAIEDTKARAATYEAYGAQVGAVFSAIGAQVEKNISQNQKLLTGVGAATEAAFGGILKGLGKQFFAQGLGELAAGIAAASSVVLAPTAPGHFSAAAAYGVAAAATGFAGVLTSGDAGRRQGSASAAASAPSSSGGSGFGGGFSGGGSVSAPTTTALPSVNLYLGGAPGSTTIHAGTGEEAAARAGRWIEDAQAAALRAGPRLQGGHS